jgi:folate-binding protein YgfZ
MIQAALLSNRGYLMISGEDKIPFLQGILTNDVSKVSDDTSLYTLLLTPQGRYNYDLFISKVQEDWVIEGDLDRLQALLDRLNTYKLRSKVSLKLDSDHNVLALWTPHGLEHKVSDDLIAESLNLPAKEGATQTTNLWTAFIDPRLSSLGARLRIHRDHMGKLSDCLGMELVDEADYVYHRLTYGVPESASELDLEKSIPLECGMDELNAISWDKGCYVGQELTARTRYRGLVRKRLFPFVLTGSINPEDPILLGDKEVGSWYTVSRDRGLGLLRLEALNTDPLTCGGIIVLPHTPFWMKLDESGN